MEAGLVPDAAVGDFDSLSGQGLVYLDTLSETEIVRLKPEKDDSDTQHALNYAIDRGRRILLFLEPQEAGSIIFWRTWNCFCWDGKEE